MTTNDRAQFDAAVEWKGERELRVRELRLEYRARPDLDISDAYRNLATPHEAVGFLMQLLAHEATEVFGIICLSIKHDFICWHEVARGSLDQCHVHPREVFKAALLANAACIVLGHNHPSGHPIPSPDDEELTRRLAASGTLLGVDVMDHIIIGDQRYYSFKEGGRL